MNITPRILCDEPQTILQNITPPLYDRLMNTLNNLVKEEHDSVIHTGLTDSFSIGIFNFLYDELSKITKYKYREWCEQTTSAIITNVNLCIVGLREIDKLLYLSVDELSKLVYRIITYQLYDENKLNGFLDNIFYYDDESNNDSSEIHNSLTDTSDLTTSECNTDSNTDSDTDSEYEQTLLLKSLSKGC